MQYAQYQYVQQLAYSIIYTMQHIWYIVQEVAYIVYCIEGGMWYAGAQPRAITAITLTPCSQSNNRRCHRCNNKLESNPALRATLNAATLGLATAISYKMRKNTWLIFFARYCPSLSKRPSDLEYRDRLQNYCRIRRL